MMQPTLDTHDATGYELSCSALHPPTSAATRPQWRNDDDVHHQRRQTPQFLSLLLPPAASSASAWRTTPIEVDDTSSAGTSTILLNASKDSFSNNEPETSQSPADFSQQPPNAGRRSSFVLLHDDASTAPDSWKKQTRRKSASSIDWILLPSQSSPSYCAAFAVLDTVWDSATTRATEEPAQDLQHEVAAVQIPYGNYEAPDAVSADDDDGDKDGEVQQVDENYWVRYALSRPTENTPLAKPSEDVVHPSLLTKGVSPRASLADGNATPSTCSESCRHSDVGSSVWDSVALSSLPGLGGGLDDAAWELSEDNVLKTSAAATTTTTTTPRRRRSTQSTVINRNAWRSSLSSVGGVPAIRVSAEPRDLYRIRRNVVARQCWW